MRIKEVIVVEGKDDTAAIKRAVEADTIETNGAALNDVVFKQIELAMERRGVIIFTDPDYQGERIRRLISERFPSCKHAFLPREKAFSKKMDDIGIENASPEAIRYALRHAKKEKRQSEAQIGWNDLHAAGLVGNGDAKRRRERLGALLHIGYANGKQFLRRLHAFRITKAEFQQALKRMFDEEKSE